MNFDSIPETVDGLPNFSGLEDRLETVAGRPEPVFLPRTPFHVDRLQASFSIGLHMHQPLVLDDGDLRNSPIVGNLQYMMERQHVHGNHDAPVFAQCYSRTADFIRELVDAGKHPRVMLDYSGCLLFGLRQMGRGDILDNLKTVVQNDRYWPSVEWLGTMWGHSVAPSTPIPDLKLHIRAWQQQFAAIFGWEALRRVRGFSPPEMHLPNHPFHESRSLGPRDFKGRRLPPMVLQISDGENGGVMMNECPGNYKGAWSQIGAEGVVGINGTEYLELLQSAGLSEKDFEPIQPLHQSAIWQRVGANVTPDAVAKAVEDAQKSDHRFHFEGGSWTNNLSWVRGYENVLDPMNKLSAQFHQKLDGRSVDRGGQPYRNALFHLLTAQTSCYRYWGQGRWTDYAREICRRGSDILTHNFS